MEVSARAVVDITVYPVPAGSLDLCLPVPAGLHMEAQNRSVVLVWYGG